MFWLRRLIRNNMRPMSEHKARVWHGRLNVIYNVSTFSALAAVIYACFHGRADWAGYHGLKSEEEMKLTPGNC